MTERTTLISGAGRGIGRAIAERLAAHGQTVIGISTSEPAGAFPGHWYKADLGDREETAAVLDEITGRFAIDHVVNNVGVANPQALAEVDLDVFAATLDLNLRTTVQLSQAALPAMRAKGRGRIVNISSRAALGRRLRTGYAAAKSGLFGLSKSWAMELAEEGITVNVIAPGLTDTEMMRRNNPDIDERAQRIPMKRLARPDDIAAAVEFFLSDDAAYVTGQVLHVCGGLSVGFAAM